MALNKTVIRFCRLSFGEWQTPQSVKTVKNEPINVPLNLKEQSIEDSQLIWDLLQFLNWIWRQLADLANATKHQTISCLKSNFKNTKQSQIDSAGKLTNTDNMFGSVWFG